MNLSPSKPGFQRISYFYYLFGFICSLRACAEFGGCSLRNPTFRSEFMGACPTNLSIDGDRLVSPFLQYCLCFESLFWRIGRLYVARELSRAFFGFSSWHGVDEITVGGVRVAGQLLVCVGGSPWCSWDTPDTYLDAGI